MIEKRQFYINGTWVDPVQPHDHKVIDPSTEEPCAVISLGSAADVDAEPSEITFRPGRCVRQRRLPRLDAPRPCRTHRPGRKVS